MKKNGTLLLILAGLAALFFASRAKAAEPAPNALPAPTPASGGNPNLAQYLAWIATAADKYAVPYPVLLGLIRRQSRDFDPVVIGSAAGIAQFAEATAAQFNVNRADPASSIDGAARYLNWIKQTLNADNWYDVAGAFLWGIGNVKNAIAMNGNDWPSKAPAWLQNDLATLFQTHA